VYLLLYRMLVTTKGLGTYYETHHYSNQKSRIMLLSTIHLKCHSSSKVESTPYNLFLCHFVSFKLPTNIG